jgi:hypothetical protein
MLVTYNIYSLAPGAIVYDFIPTAEALGLALSGVTIYALYQAGVLARLGAAASSLRGQLQPALSGLLGLLGI